MADLIYGYHPVRELLRRRPHEVVRLLVARRGDRRRRELEALARRHRLPCVRVADEDLFQRTGSAAHNGVAAEVRRPARPGAGADPDLLVLAEDVQDPRNLGALLRVCEGAGVGRVLLRDRGSAQVTPAVIKASAGASEWLPLERVTNAARTLEQLKDDGFWVYGADASGVPPWEVDLSGKVVLAVGGEHGGLRARTRTLCDRLVGLPLRGRVGSLNLATAAAALLYEAVRQRLAAAAAPPE
ncbi:MAG: RNA methyltransferase [Acidobacteria bacterium]|nr:MAG: RNA methyltransferase [Acidobacteriota bacterium]